MSSFNAPRCQHIKTSGTQCGSPALRDQRFCYYHRQSRPQDVECYEDWLASSHSGNITLPVFEDAHSIQFVIRQVTTMLLQQKIETKTASLALYALQIASANLKRMDLEKPRPTHVVIDPDKVAETPLGMTPWSATGNGHDLEEQAPKEQDTSNKAARPHHSGSAQSKAGHQKSKRVSETTSNQRALESAIKNAKMRDGMVKRGLCTQAECRDYCMNDGPDPLDRLRPGDLDPDEANLPPGTIRARATNHSGETEYVI